MFAKLVDATIDPARLDLAVRAVEEEIIPVFRSLEGALHGYWSADVHTGHVVAITMWRDLDAVRSAAAVDGATRATVGERIGLRLCSVHTLPVLACSPGADPSVDDPRVRWIRVAWADDVAPSMRERLTRTHGWADAAGVRARCAGSYWIGEEHSSEGCVLSLWDDTADVAVDGDADHRRWSRLVRTNGGRSRSVHDYRALGVTRPALDPTRSSRELTVV